MVGDVVLVANPAAANGRARRYAVGLERVLTANGMKAIVRFTSGPGDATRLARESVAAEADVVLAIGGDGTINEIVNGFFPAQSSSPPPTALAVVSVGTGTDFAKTLRQGSDPREILERLRADRRRAIDVGLVEFPDLEGRPSSRHFVNIAEFGSGGAVFEKVNRSSKVFGGRLSFLRAILSVMPKYQNTRVSWRLDDGTTGEGVVNNFVVANGRYFGGGLMPAPHAELDDGWFDVVIIGDIDWKTIKAHLKDMRQGTHLAMKEVTFHRAREVTIESHGRAFLDLDGELVGADPTRFTCVPKAINLLV